MEDENKLKEQAKQQFYTANDMHALNTKDNYTAFGHMALSGNFSEPEIGFGKATRKNREKVYQTKENMKAFLGT